MVVMVLLLCNYDGEDNGAERRYHWRDDMVMVHILVAVVVVVVPQLAVTVVAWLKWWV